MLIPNIEQRLDIISTEGLSFSDIQKSLRDRSKVATNFENFYVWSNEEAQILRNDFITEAVERIKVLRNYNVTTNYYLTYKCTDCKGFKEIIIDFQNLTIYTDKEDLKIDTDMQQIIYNAPISTYKDLTNRRLRWQDIHLSFRFSINRSPESYSPLVHAFMLSQPMGLDAFARKQRLLTKKKSKMRIVDQSKST